MAKRLQTRPSPNQLGPQALVCAVCKRPSQTAGELFCPHDGAILIDASELPNAQIDPLIGRRIESFAIVARLGEGGMGTVYRALQIGMDREVALKILRSDLAHDGKVVQRFHQEARAAARLSHRNLATVYTSGSTSDGVYYIAMEHLDGPSLEKVIASAWQEQNGKRVYTLDRLRVMRLWCQIVAALSHAHRLGIVHRDLVLFRSPSRSSAHNRWGEVGENAKRSPHASLRNSVSNHIPSPELVRRCLSCAITCAASSLGSTASARERESSASTLGCASPCSAATNRWALPTSIDSGFA